MSPRSQDARPGRAAESRVAMFATTVPGLGRLAKQELTDRSGAAVRHVGSDGRSDVVVFEVARDRVAGTLDARLTEDVFAETGRTFRSEGDRAQWIARRLWRRQRAEQALRHVWATRRRARKPTTFRVIVRVLQERSFPRTELRRQVTRLVQREQPSWQLDDPGQIEVWVVEYAPGRFLSGVRLSDAGMRQHGGGRAEERSGALRPTVAAAMVRLAGPSDGVLLDPCCGSGTILSEAIEQGWSAQGLDIDAEAVRSAGRNVRGATVSLGDVRSIDLPTGSVSACVSNLPFGRQFDVGEAMESWLSKALAELTRVTRPAGSIVLLAPRLPRASLPRGLRVDGRHQIRLLGTTATIWSCRREGRGGPSTDSPT